MTLVLLLNNVAAGAAERAQTLQQLSLRARQRRPSPASVPGAIAANAERSVMRRDIARKHNDWGSPQPAVRHTGSCSIVGIHRNREISEPL